MDTTKFWVEQAEPAFFESDMLCMQMSILMSQLDGKPVRHELRPRLVDTAKNACMLLAWERVGLDRSSRNNRDSLVGTVTMNTLYETVSRWGLIEDVVVLEKHRRKGIARELMTRVISAARSREMKSVELWTNISREPAHTLYRSLGFENLGQFKSSFLFSKELK